MEQKIDAIGKQLNEMSQKSQVESERHSKQLNDILEQHTQQYNDIKNIIMSMSNSIQTLNRRITEIETEIETNQTAQRSDLGDIKTQLNNLKQENLISDFVLYGLPPETTNETAVEIVKNFSDAVNVPIVNDEITKCFVRSNAAKSEAIIIGSFSNANIKNRIMKNYRTKRPIVMEHVMELEPTSPWRGKEVTMRNQLTDHTRQLLKEAQRRKEDRMFVWERNGRVMLKKDEGDRAIWIQSIEQLNTVLPFRGTANYRPTSSSRHNR